jgi:ANTAR domain
MLHEQMSQAPWGSGRSWEGRRVLDIAVGILVALRRCSIDAAFAEIIAAAQGHDVPVFSIASALVGLAHADFESRGDTPAQLAADRQWGGLLAGSDIRPGQG